MVGWHHRLDGHKFEQAPEVGDGQGSLACCSPWGCKESDMTEQLNGTDDFECMCACVIDRQSLRERRERVCVGEERGCNFLSLFRFQGSVSVL